MTGDGRDDFCCLGPDGGVVCWQNTPGSDARSPNWVSLGTVKPSEGYPQAQVRLADIDGDGRCDYVVFDSTTTNIYGWRNGALDNSPPAYWYAMRGVISGLPPKALSGWKFADLNGDKKDDLIWVSPDGQVTTWINRRGFSVGLGPAFVSHGVTHAGSASAVNVTFGASLGSGRADYALTSIQNGKVYVERWQNQDQGGTMVRGDGSFYCDMTGSGSDDYVFIDAFGSVTLFENDHNWGYWIPWGVIATISALRQDIHLADFDGDGKCDILVVNKQGGQTAAYINQYANGKFTFNNIGIVTGSATCTEGYGADKHDRGVRWNDLDGDKRADFLCMQSNGVVDGYLNKGVNNMVYQGLIKHAEGKERKNLRFADINGDGRDDLVWVDMITGAVTAWYNGGAVASSGSAFQWNWQGVVASGGSSRGQCVEFGALYGLGRADYIVVEPATNQAWTWFNVCPDGAGPEPPNLPSGAPPPPNPAPGQSLPPSASIVKATTTDYNGHTTTLTDTVIITRATDSKGSTIVGTITEGPQPTTTPPPTSSLSTYTVFPPGVSWYTTSVPSNTHDPSHHPVLAPWPQCWFCPPGSHGIVLINIGPGVYPPGGPPAGLPTPFPALTIEPDGTPQYTSEEDDKCTTKTVTDYWVSCDVSEVSCTTTSSHVISGCDAQQMAYTTAPFCEAGAYLDDQEQQDLSVTINSINTPTTTGASPSATKSAPSPTSTAVKAYPTLTSDSSQQAYCFKTSDGPYVSYDISDSGIGAASFCERHPVLDPASSDPIVESVDDGTTAITIWSQARWAPVQSGCGTKASYYFNPSSTDQNSDTEIACEDYFTADYLCVDHTGGTGSSGLGGGYVMNTGKGCIEITQYAVADTAFSNNVRVLAKIPLAVLPAPSTVVEFVTTVARNLSAVTTMEVAATWTGVFDLKTLTGIGGKYFNSSAVG
ncbi:hypothetical protein LTR86_003983 [Recurvomyces mirabilis]|nr:hypothetical protein LTR86_003983 [Recurvomyces mirabilis]